MDLRLIILVAVIASAIFLLVFGLVDCDNEENSSVNSAVSSSEESSSEYQSPENIYYSYDNFTYQLIGDEYELISIHDYEKKKSVMLAQINGKRVARISENLFADYFMMNELYFEGSLSDWCSIEFLSKDSNPLTNEAKLFIDNVLISQLEISGFNVGNFAFCDYIHLTKLTLGEGVNLVGDWAFSHCFNLKEVTVLSSDIVFGENAFNYNEELETLTLLSGVKGFGSDCFNATSKLAVVNYGGSADDWASISFANENSTPLKNAILYINNQPLTHLTLNCEIVNGYAFSYYNRLLSVIIGDNVQKIGKNAFFQAVNLMHMQIGEKVTEIQNGAFERCYRLVEILNKSALNIEVGNSIDNGKIGENAICVYNGKQDYNSSLSEFNGVVYIENEADTIAVNYLGSEGEITLMDRTTKIANYAFYDCDLLEKVAISQFVTDVGRCAFRDCNNLVSASFNCELTAVGNYAFENCKSLQEITFTGLIKVGAFAFQNCSVLREIVLPKGLTHIGQSSFSHCVLLERVVLPSTLQEISSAAFFDCENLKYIQYGGNQASWNNVIIKSQNEHLLNATMMFFIEN